MAPTKRFTKTLNKMSRRVIADVSRPPSISPRDAIQDYLNIRSREDGLTRKIMGNVTCHVVLVPAGYIEACLNQAPWIFTRSFPSIDGKCILTATRKPHAILQVTIEGKGYLSTVTLDFQRFDHQEFVKGEFGTEFLVKAIEGTEDPVVLRDGRDSRRLPTISVYIKSYDAIKEMQWRIEHPNEN